MSSAEVISGKSNHNRKNKASYLVKSNTPSNKKKFRVTQAKRMHYTFIFDDIS